MKIYFAVTGEQEPKYLPKNGIRNILMSYHYYKKKLDLVIDVNKNNNIFIDSGAFSAENAGQTIDIDKYCEFLKIVKVKNYACLDVIGDAKETLKNQKYMEKKGLSPIPTFHMKEHINDLVYLALNYDYIALGGMVFSENIENWLDSVWKELLTINPKIRVHAFGMTNTELIQKYPWHSIDSSSFKSGKRFGRLILYNQKKHEFITLNYNDWIQKYYNLTFNEKILEDNFFKYEITDVLSAQSYQRFVENCSTNKNKFKYLTQQKTLF